MTPDPSTEGTGGTSAAGAGGAGLRVVVVGATGNAGTSVVRALADDPQVGSVLGVARRTPGWSPPKTTWASADVGREDAQRDGRSDGLTRLFRGADAVVHLAWLFQPTHRPTTTWRTNVLGSLRVFAAAAEAGVPALVHASSVGAYSPGPKDRQVDESWPTHGWPEAAYCREKSYLERALDSFELDHPDIRVVRMRPGFLFKEEAASEQRRLFAGPFLPQRLVRPGLVPLVPGLPGLRMQTLHTDDAAQAYRLAVTGTARGAFNLAADPVVDADVLAGLLDARVVRMPLRPVRTALAAGWHSHLLPASPHLFDAVLRLPLMDTGRARRELGWTPRWTADEAVAAFLGGLRNVAGTDTPPLRHKLRGGRLRELRTGVGEHP
ncbi:NAD-dependent epimerase [Streptomyces abyssalis]|uniref:NAD-dependent epimerase n=1 Tax=Streptomyces abyssalis TaxID=933944 RepID=A0A1E7JN51_9ACTN|nr:NAD-dependent epimerase/dehydratase family protein [Streptomyces abyssalis]OEU86940.1 NAD-dependent epimerase [Streptomyces abyssalis]OEU89675.1 NAD-dependent epimerase [Streptomyces abyssalis]OEV31286.1 NAD-dependent epimerase [Streptomyces nanshensis]